MDSKISATHAAVPLRGEWCLTVYVREGHEVGQNVACSLGRHTNKKGMRIFFHLSQVKLFVSSTHKNKKAAVTSTTFIM